MLSLIPVLTCAVDFVSRHVVAERGYGRSGGKRFGRGLTVHRELIRGTIFDPDPYSTFLPASQLEVFHSDKKMSLHEVLTVTDDRETAQGPLLDAIHIGTDLIQHPKNKEEQLREEAFQDGLDILEDALCQYCVLHKKRS